MRFELAGGVYHVMARGNERKAIFRDDSDRHAFMERLVGCRKRFGFRLYAFCLMSNHVHLAVERGEVALSRIMLALSSAYAQDFNRRHGRVGHLFHGRYKAFLVQKDVYLLTLVRYINFNPVHARLAVRPQDYRWSSDRHYRAREAPPWLGRDAVLAGLGPTPALAAIAYRQLMSTDDSIYEDAAPTASVIKGTDLFAGQVLASARRSATGGPARREWSVERIATAAAASAGLTVDQLRALGQQRRIARERAIVAYVAWKYARVALAETARFFEREESTLVHAVRRIEAAWKLDRALSERVRAVVAAIGRPRARRDPAGESSGVHG